MEILSQGQLVSKYFMDDERNKCKQNNNLIVDLYTVLVMVVKTSLGVYSSSKIWKWQ